MPDFTRIFAESGLKNTIGDVEYDGGWDDIVGSNPPSFKDFNSIMNEQDSKLADIAQAGIVDWDANIPYQANGLTKGSDGTIYQCLVEQNGNDPVSDDGTNWIPIIYTDKAKTVSIPTDYPDLQTALDAVSKLYNSKNKVTVNIETGHALTGGFRIQNGDWSHVTITSDDATVPVDSAFTFVSNTDLSSDVPRTAAIGFLAVRATMPLWEILVDMSARAGTVAGYELDYGSSGAVSPGKGVINTQAGVNCRVSTSSRLTAAQSVWTGASDDNVAVTLNSFANLQTANLSGAVANANLDVSRGSVVHAKDADCSNGGTEGVYVRRSFLSGQGIDFSNNTIGCWGAIGSYVAIPDSTFDGCVTDVKCEEGSHISTGFSTKAASPLNPTDSVIGNTAGGTEAVKQFNEVGGYGIILNGNAQVAHVNYLNENSTASLITGSTQQNIASLTYQTALNLAGETICHGGTIYGPDAGIRITIDGNVVLDDAGRYQGDDNSGDLYAPISIPPCKAKSSLLIEVFNRASVAADYGWRIYHD